jgi:hypothetical protein
VATKVFASYDEGMPAPIKIAGLILAACSVCFVTGCQSGDRTEYEKAKVCFVGYDSVIKGIDQLAPGSLTPEMKQQAIEDLRGEVDRAGTALGLTEPQISAELSALMAQGEKDAQVAMDTGVNPMDYLKRFTESLKECPHGKELAR